MARRPRLFAPGLLYHVIVRGNQRRKTFLNDQDYQAYLERLARYRSWPVSKARTMIGYVLVRRQGYALGKVASYFGRDAATVGILIGRLAARMSEDEALRQEIDRLNKKV